MSKNKCNKCKKQVTTKGISCDGCQSWFHASCVNIKEDELTFLGSNKASKWFCKQCLPDINEVLKNLQKFKEAGQFIKELEQKLENRLKKLEDQTESMRQNTPPPAPASDVPKDKLDKLTEVMHDMRRENLELKIDNDSQEQYERRDTVVVYNVTERGRNEDLHLFALQLCAATGGSGLSPLEVSTAHRLGNPNSSKCRPVIIKFTRRCTKDSLMRNKYKLKNTPGWERVFVEEGLTPWRRCFVNELKLHTGITRVLTKDGKIYFTVRDKRWELNLGADFIKLLDAGFMDKKFMEAVGIDPRLSRYSDRPAVATVDK